MTAAALAMPAILLAGLAGCGPHRGAGGATDSSNLLLVTVDTLRADRVGAYGGAAGTPALDRLAHEGIRFATVSAAAPLTLPSHATILSGLLPPHHGLRDNGAGRFPDDRATLATLLAGAGYRTGAFVSAFVLDHRFGLARGFEVYDDEVERSPEGVAELESERRGDRTVDRALTWLAAADRRPFFLWVHLYDPHFPYRPPQPYRSRSPGARRPEGPGPRDPAYDGEVAFADAQVGRLLGALDRKGLAGRTVVAVAADHGEALGEHGEPTHGLFLYESTLRVPLLLRLPGRPGGRVVTTPVSLADLAPTLAGLLGRDLAAGGDAPGAPDGRLDGRNLAPDLEAGREPAPADLYAETRYPRIFGWSGLSSLRRRDLKYIAAPRPELYDLARDPGEASNLAAIPATSGNAAAPARPEARGFAERLAAIEAGAVAPTPGAAPDEETRKRLASLGYASPGPGTAAAGPRGDAGLPDPKDRADLFRRYEQARAALDQSLDRGRAADAGPELAALVAADPANPVFRARLAELRRRQGEPGEAAALYRQAVAIAPADADAWYNLGMTLSEAGEIAEARTALERTLALDPGRAEAHNALGILDAGTGRPEEARAELARAAQLDPRSGHAWNNLGNVLRTLGRPAEAEAAYRRAVAAAPRYAEPWNGLGTLEVERDRPAAALSYFDRALALAPGYHEVRLNRAIALQMAGDAAGARAGYKDFLEATGQDPHFEAQRRAARQLLARLSDREAGNARPERR